MNTIDTLATFFGWCTVINFTFIILVLLVFSLFHDGIGKIAGSLFGVPKEEAKAAVLHAFMQYRVALVVLNLVPFIALKIMA